MPWPASGRSFAEQGRLLAELRRQQGLFTPRRTSRHLFRAAPLRTRAARPERDFAAITGYPRERFLGRGELPEESSSRRIAPRWRRRSRSALTTGRYDVVYRIREAGGAVRWMHETGAAWRDEDGATVFDANRIDVTEERLREDQLRQRRRWRPSACSPAARARLQQHPDVIVGATSLAASGWSAPDRSPRRTSRRVAASRSAFRAKARRPVLALSRPKALKTVRWTWRSRPVTSRSSSRAASTSRSG